MRGARNKRGTESGTESLSNPAKSCKIWTCEQAEAGISFFPKSFEFKDLASSDSRGGERRRLAFGTEGYQFESCRPWIRPPTRRSY
jgi:hypothetical protein